VADKLDDELYDYFSDYSIEVEVNFDEADAFVPITHPNGDGILSVMMRIIFGYMKSRIGLLL
jgi:hypothetical protein